MPQLSETKFCDGLEMKFIWASERFFPGGASRGFSQKVFQWGQKWWNLFFTPRNRKNNLFCQ